MRLKFTLVSNLLILFHLLVLNTKHALLQNSILFFSIKLKKDRILVLWRKPLNMVRLTHGWVFWYPTVGRDFGDDGSGGVNRIPRLLNALLSYNRLKLGKWWGGGCLAVMGYCNCEIGKQIASCWREGDPRSDPDLDQQKFMATMKFTARNIVYSEGIVCYSEYAHYLSQCQISTMLSISLLPNFRINLSPWLKSRHLKIRNIILTPQTPLLYPVPPKPHITHH